MTVVVIFILFYGGWVFLIVFYEEKEGQRESVEEESE